MSLTLYRKYRPKRFDEVIGQDQVISILKNALKNNSISHAYIFAGGRGIGKTSIARIFSEALGTSQNDTYEIDAASNRGIDDIRAVRDAVNTLPFESKFKVYIIDEAHMLTKEAWNALLKTLEEPPAHVIFILATTEPEKIPETILSRCEIHHFKKPSQSILRDFVLDVAKKEKVEIENSASDLIALLADGSFRDAHGILQKIISSANTKKITREETEKITGAPKISLINSLIQSLVLGDASKAISILGQVSKENLDVLMFAKLLLETVRQILLFRISPSFHLELREKIAKEQFDFIEKIASEGKSSINAETLREFILAYEQINYSHIPTLPLELAVIKILEKKSV